MVKEPKNKIKSWAEFRFSVIGRLLSCPPEPGDLRKEIEKLAFAIYLHPIKDKPVRFGASTIERWYYQAKDADDPIDALSRKIRSDSGTHKTMPTPLINELRQQYKTYPHWSYQLHFDNLVALIGEKPDLGDIPSYSTVLRRMKKYGWMKTKKKPKNQTEGQIKAIDRIEQKEVRGFEVQYANALWHLDFHQSHRRICDSKGNWHKPYVLGILDDHSRLCCHMQWYLNETTEVLFHGLSQAFYKRGLPRALMTDNGSAMISHETINGLLRLGIKHEKTLAYSPYQNGKQESFWGRLEGRLMAMLSKVEPLSLEFLNKSSLAWIEQEYNRGFHDEIRTSPMKRYLGAKDMSRSSPDRKTLTQAFIIKQKRNQRKSDGTVSIQGIRFEIPSCYRHIDRFWIGYQSWDLSKAYLLDQKTGDVFRTIFPQDKTKNSSGLRRALTPCFCEPIQFELESNNDPLPPLLRKMLKDYSQYGLPPAYISKEKDENHESS